MSDLIRINVAAKMLTVSVRTVQRWIATGRLPAVRLSPKSVRVRRSDVENLISTSCEKDGDK